MSDKNKDIIELVIEGSDEYSDVSEAVRAEMTALADKTKATRTEFDKLEKSLDLAGTYRAQEQEVNRLAEAQAKAKQEVTRLTQADREARGANVELVAQLAKAKAEFGSLRTATNRVQKAFDATKDSMRRYGVDLEKVEASQSDYRQTAERLSGELADLSVAQTKLVSTAQEEVEVAREAVVAKKAQAEEAERLTIALQKQQAEAEENLRVQRKTREESEKYERTLTDLIANLRTGKITWEQYNAQMAKAADGVELARRETAKIGRAFQEQAIEARNYAKEQDKLIAQQKAAVAEQKDAEIQQRKNTEQTARYTKVVQDLSIELRDGSISWEDYKRKTTDAARATDLSRQQISKINAALDAQVVAARKAAEASRQQAAEDKRLEVAAQRYRLELEKLVGAYQNGKLSADQFARSEEILRQKLYLSEDQVAETRRELKAYANQLQVIPAGHDKAARSTDRLTQVTRRLAQAYAALLAAQKGAEQIAGGYREYTNTENAMVGLAKTTTLTAAEIQDLADKMQHLSGDITPTTKVQLLEVAAAAGRMGVEGAENIGKFTKSIDALSSATDLAGNDTAQAVAQILNVTGEAQKNVVGVSAAIADLGNNTATTEEQIVHFSKRLASDTATVHLTSAEVLGLGAALAEMGLQSEGSSTVVGRSFRYIEDAVKGGGLAMEDLMRVTGLSSEALEKAYGEDKIALFSKFLQGLGRMQDGGETLNGILDQLGIKSDENARILGLLSQRYEGITTNVNLSNKAFEAGNAHFEEAAKKAATLSTGFERLQNRAKALQEKFGEAFSDDLSRAMNNTLADTDALDETFAELGEVLADVVEKFSGFFGAVDSLLSVIPGANSEIGLMDGLLTSLGAIFETVTIRVSWLVAGIAKLAIAWNEFFGDTDDVEYWSDVQDKALERASSGIQRLTDDYDRLAGESSRAFQDLRDTYAENREALGRLDADQRKAAETILKSTGYIQGNDAVYRDLTRAIQRASEEKRILAGYTEEENAALNNNVALLKAQGVAEDEAIRRSQEKLAAKRQEQEVAEQARLEAEKEAKAAALALETDEKEYKQRQEEKAKLIKAQGEAWKALGLDIDEVTEGITEQGREAADAFLLLATEGEYSAEQISKAFDSALSKTRTKADIEALISTLERARDTGVITGETFRTAFDQASDKIKGVKRDTKDAADEVDGFNDALEETGKVGTGSIGDLTRAIRELITEVAKLQQGYEAAAESAQKMRDAGDGEGSHHRSHGGGSDTESIKRGKLGAAQRQELLETGDRLAVEIYDELIAGLSKTLSGKVLSPYDDTVVAEPKRLAKLARQQSAAASRPGEDRRRPGFDEQLPAGSGSQLVRIEFDRAGVTHALIANNESAQAFLDNLVEVGAITR